MACVDDDTGRRFANEPMPTADAGATATASGGVQVTPTSVLPVASPVSVDQLLAAPGGVSTIVVQVGDDLIAIGPPWTQPRTIWSGPEDSVLAYGAAPAGDLVALLLAAGQQSERVDLVLIAGDGTPVRQVEDLGRSVPESTLPGAAEGISSLGWAPDGSQVLVGLATGGILTVPRTGDPEVLVGPGRAAAPGQVAWSPRGDAIAYIAPASPGAAGGLYVAPTGAVPLDPVPALPPSAGGRSTVSRFAWSPDGEMLYYTLASTTGDPTFGGDLFQIPSAGGTPKLVAGASRVGPVSAITNFAISPDGAGVAYVVTVPGDDGRPNESLWLQPIAGGEAVRLPLGTGERAGGLWWTTDGLIWSALSATGDAELILYRAAPGEAPGLVYPAAPATPVASPAATPVASPESSPIASPVAT
jgi:hypothetical protein